MDLLPDEILEAVFHYLSAPERLAICARVCRRWRHVVRRRTLAILEDGDQRHLRPATHAVLITAFPLDLFAVMTDITIKVRYLREITAHASAPFHEPHMAALRLLPHLAHLDVFARPRLLDARLVDIVKRLRLLVANETLAPALLRSLESGSQLVALHMFGRSVHFPRREMMAALKARAPHLLELTLRCQELPDSAYHVIGDCGNLRSLQLYSCWLLGPVGARALCRPRRVRRLHVTGARLVRTQALADMLQLLPASVHELVLSGGWFGDGHVGILAQATPALRVLELWSCKLSARGALRLAAALPTLEQLDLDMTLTQSQQQCLARHPRLRLVRCTPAAAGHDPMRYMDDHPLWQVDGLQLVATHAPYARKYFHTGGEGFRASLFYYWTQDVPLEPLPPIGQTGANASGDLFY